MAKEEKAVEAKENKGPSQVDQCKAIVEKAGAEGVGAEEIGQKLGLIKEGQSKEDRTAALKKVRVLARKATGGSATKRDGRTAVYIIG